MIILQTVLVIIILILNWISCKQDGISMEEFAEKLHREKICTDTGYKKLLVDMSKRELVNPIEFLYYCDKAVVINLKDEPDESDEPDEPENYLEKIHRTTASVIPELNFSDFNFTVELDSSISDSESKFYDFVVSLKSNGRVYKQRSFWHLYDSKHNRYFGGKICRQEYYEIFNKILVDIQSPFRLHEVKAYNNHTIGQNCFGIIALTKEQADMLRGGRSYVVPSYESFQDTLTSDRITTVISEYQKIGLFSHLTSEQIQLAIEKNSQQTNHNLNGVLQSFPNVMYYFDAELGNLEDPYAEILKELSLISKGAFQPTNITDHFSKPVNNKIRVKFSVNGNEYSKDFQYQDDWMDVEFIDFLKNVVADNKLGGQFYELYTGGQDMSIIFLTVDQEQYLRTNKLLLFADQWYE